MEADFIITITVNSLAAVTVVATSLILLQKGYKVMASALFGAVILMASFIGMVYFPGILETPMNELPLWFRLLGILSPVGLFIITGVLMALAKSTPSRRL